MSRVTDRERLVAQLTRELPDHPIGEVVDLARKLLRAGATLQRLAEAQCNGDWPADNGERQSEECEICESSWHPSVLKAVKLLQYRGGSTKLAKKVCPDCRTQSRVMGLCADYGLTPIFNGDPRGAVFLVIPPSYAQRNAGKDLHNLEGIYVS